MTLTTRKAEPLTIIPGRSLHTKLAQVMYEAERIPKNGTAPREMGGYKFVQVGDAADYIRKALAEKGLTMMPTGIEVLGEVEHATKSGGTITTYTVRMEWTITDADTGETIVIPSIGVGSDTGDKFASKATTSAMKYALLSGFLLSTGEDTEGANLPDRQTQRPVGRYEAPPDRPELERTTHDEGLVGIAERGKAKGKDADGNPKGPPAETQYELRQDPTNGYRIGFRLTQGRKGYKVLAFGPIAEALAMVDIIGERVTCWGTMHDESFVNDDGKTITYQSMHLERIVTPDVIIPSDSEPETVPMGLVPDDDLSDLAGYQ